MAAPRRHINPLLLDRVRASGLTQKHLASAAGYPNFTIFFETLRADSVRVTPLVVLRLERVARAVQFPLDEIFLDEVSA